MIVEGYEGTKALREVADYLRQHTSGKMDMEETVIRMVSSLSKVKTHDVIEPEILDYDPELMPKPFTGEFETGNPALDTYLLGGMRRGELAYVSGSAGQGKTSYLISRGAHILANYTASVLHITLEISPEIVHQRYTESLLRLELPSIEQKDLTQLKNDIMGSLKIVGMIGRPTTSAVDEIVTKIKPDVAIVDYGDLLHSSVEDNRFSELGGVWNQLKKTAETHHCLVWTASRVNSDGRDSESYLKKYEADLACYIDIQPEEEGTGRGSLKIRKVRRPRGNGESVRLVYHPENCWIA